jgi:hypothetical protein
MRKMYGQKQRDRQKYHIPIGGIMLLTTLFSAFCLLTGPVVVNQSIEVIRQHHLETVEGRTTFLADELSAYATAANQLNREVTDLSQTIETLSPQNDQQQILDLTKEMIQKMARLTTMMSVLNSALSVNEDFLQIDSILHQLDPLTPAQQEIVDRVAFLCSAVDSPIES